MQSAGPVHCDWNCECGLLCFVCVFLSTVLKCGTQTLVGVIKAVFCASLLPFGVYQTRPIPTVVIKHPSSIRYRRRTSDTRPSFVYWTVRLIVDSRSTVRRWLAQLACCRCEVVLDPSHADCRLMPWGALLRLPLMTMMQAVKSVINDRHLVAETSCVAHAASPNRRRPHVRH